MPPSEPAKLLLVDDVDKNLLALEGLLQDEGITLIKAHSGPEALELLLVHEFALALLDVQMPGMDGFEVAELMRGTERTRSIPIIFITAIATDERRRFRGYEAGAVDYLLKPFDPHTLKSKVTIFVELDRQRRDLARQRDELRSNAERLSAALARIQAHGDNSPLAIVEFDPLLHVLSWSKGAERMFGWTACNVVGQRIFDIPWLHEADRPTFQTVISELVSGRAPRATQLVRTYHKDGGIVECEWYHSVLLDAAGRPVSINSQILDVTERKRAEETQHLLIGELNHRVKNTLATVQAIASQSLRHSESPTTFATDFTGRLQSLARAHSLLSDSTWKGASFLSLIEDQLRVGTMDEQRLKVSGPDVLLAPQLALHLAMILHELVTNAHKYGALSAPQGRVDISWTVDDEKLRLTWTESGTPGVRAPSRRGFGTLLIERTAQSSAGGAHATYGADGVTWDITLSIPMQSNQRIPGRAAAALAAGQTALGARVGRHSTRLSGKRFIVVEDEPAVALNIAGILEDAGIEIVGVAGATEQALQLIEAATCDGAFLDANLHGRSVDEIAAALTRRGVPFAFVSGYGQDNLPQAFAGAAAIMKPFDAAEMLKVAEDLTRARGEVVALRREL